MGRGRPRPVGLRGEASAKPICGSVASRPSEHDSRPTRRTPGRCKRPDATYTGNGGVSVVVRTCMNGPVGLVLNRP